MRYSKILLVLIIGTTLLFGCSKEDDEQEITDNVEPEVTEDETNDTTNNSATDEDVSSSQGISPEVLAFLEELPDAPSDASDIIRQTAGPFAMYPNEWNDERIAELLQEFEKIEPLPENATEEEMIYISSFSTR